MTEPDDVQYRTHHQPDPEQVTLRDPTDEEDGIFTVRMPIASTGEVRNEGDEPLTRDELAGMAEQIDAGSVGVFLDHGASTLGGGGGMFGNRYSAIGKVGTWEAPEVVDQQDDGGPALLEASARLMDPETLPAATGEVREALASLKSQVERDIPLSSSIGWREADGAPGGNDLMEASIVGIPADPRTVSDNTAAVARAAVEAGVDPDEFLEEVRAVVMGPNEGGNARDSMADDDSSEPDAESGTDEEETEQRDAPEWAQELLELQRQQTETLETVADAVQEDDMDDEDGDGDEDDEDEDDEQSAESDETDEQSAELVDSTEASDDVDEDDRAFASIDGEEVSVNDIREMREQLAEARDEGAIETPDVEDDEEGENRETNDGERNEDEESHPLDKYPETLQ